MGAAGIHAQAPVGGDLEAESLDHGERHRPRALILASGAGQAVPEPPGPDAPRLTERFVDGLTVPRDDGSQRRSDYRVVPEIGVVAGREEVLGQRDLGPILLDHWEKRGDCHVISDLELIDVDWLGLPIGSPAEQAVVPSDPNAPAVPHGDLVNVALAWVLDHGAHRLEGHAARHGIEGGDEDLPPLDTFGLDRVHPVRDGAHVHPVVVEDNHGFVSRDAVEDAHDARVDAVEAVIGHGHGLGEALGLVVHAARAHRVDVAPVVLALRVHERVAVHLGGRGEEEPGAACALARPSALCVPSAPTLRVWMGSSR